MLHGRDAYQGNIVVFYVGFIESGYLVARQFGLVNGEGSPCDSRESIDITLAAVGCTRSDAMSS